MLLSSHIEAYIKELGQHTLDKIYDKSVCRSKIPQVFFYHISKETLENIRSVSDAEGIVRHMHTFINSEIEMWARSGSFPAPIRATSFNAGFSNPKFDKVKAYFGRFGYGAFLHDYQVLLGRDAAQLKSKLDQIVDARNAIAHGDPLATRTPAEIADMVETSRRFCRTVDKIFGDWCGKSLCSIR